MDGMAEQCCRSESYGVSYFFRQGCIRQHEVGAGIGPNTGELGMPCCGTARPRASSICTRMGFKDQLLTALVTILR